MFGEQAPRGHHQGGGGRGGRAQGQGGVADLLSGVDVVPGQGVDFDGLGRILLMVLALYVGSALLGFFQGYVLNGVVQRTIYQMRSEVEDKLNRLPFRYFDRQPRGELLSRVTNDIDNVSQTLQQTMSQFLTSLLTVDLRGRDDVLHLADAGVGRAGHHPDLDAPCRVWS